MGYSRVSLNRLFLSEEYKQYLTFSVEISTNTLITQYSKHLWSDEQEHTHNRIKSLHGIGKGYRTITKFMIVGYLLGMLEVPPTMSY